MKKERIYFFDNVKGILIILVVLGHFLWESTSNDFLNNLLIKLIYFFHMPLFVFVSGYFSKKINKQNIKKLLIYYLIFNTLMGLYLHFTTGSELLLFDSYNSYWYLLSIITMRLIIDKIDKIKGLIPLSIIIGLLSGFYDFQITFITKTLTLLPFFIIGYKLPEDKILTYIKNKNISKVLISIISLLLFLSLFLLTDTNLFITRNTLTFMKYAKNSDILIRLSIYLCSFLMILFFFSTLSNKKHILITKWGQNSLYIFIIHRFITLIFPPLLLTTLPQYYLSYILIAFITLLFLGNTPCQKTIDKLYSKIEQLKPLYVVLIIIALLSIIPVENFIKENNVKQIIQTPITDNYTYTNENNIKITYIGDLILLKDQVDYSKINGQYSFDYMFYHTTKYLQNADYTIGVYEGPSAGANAKYSNSNFDDGILIKLNYPDAFISSIKKAGIDMVTTSNNHMLDKNIDGALRTLDILEMNNIEHIGTYRNSEEYNSLKIITIKNKKIAFLSYSYGSNYTKEDYFFKDNKTFAKIITTPESAYFEESKNIVINDIISAKQQNVDYIIVTAHMGTQFQHSTDKMQQTWNKIFAENGVDVVLGDHSHATQPIEYIGDTIIVNSPGNFANLYTKNDGDATAIVNIYLDTNENKVIKSSIIPMYTHKISTGLYQALPIYDIMTNKELSKTLNHEEIERSQEIFKIVTKTMLDMDIPITNIQEELFFQPCQNINLEENLNNRLLKLLQDSSSIVFIGDSLTEGTKNNFHPWYEPLIKYLPHTQITNISKGGITLKQLYNNYQDKLTITAATYVIAIGANDIRYHNQSSTLTSREYVEYMNKLIAVLQNKNQDATIIILDPWLSLDYDPYSKLELSVKNKLYQEFSTSLNQEYQDKSNIIIINQNDYLQKFYKNNNSTCYLIDHIHPNNTDGLSLYSKAFLESY